MTSAQAKENPNFSTPSTTGLDTVVLGKKLRHHRLRLGLRLADVAEQVDTTTSFLSLVENGKREPKLSLISALAQEYQVSVDELLSADVPSRRAGLEIAVEKAQRSAQYKSMGLPQLKISSTTPDDVLEVISGLHAELRRRDAQRRATPEVARQANVELRQKMRRQNNYFPELEAQAQELLDAVGHTTGPLTQHAVADLAEYLGFSIRFVNSLPHSTRSVTDLKNRRFYLSDANSPDHDTRSVLLQAIAAYVLGHGEPKDYLDFLSMRVETNYVAAALLMPQRQLARQLKRAKAQRDLAIEDIRDGYGVSYESAAHRFTNLATEFLDITCHFQKVHESGVIYKAYENDGVNFPVDSIGAIEGQSVCRYWTSREVFAAQDRFRAFNQYTDTATGTFWCTAVVEGGASGVYSLSIGLPFESARWFRGSDTPLRSVSKCPDPRCCRLPSSQLEDAWGGHAWPAARTNTNLLAAMPAGVFPGVDNVEVYEFLQAQSEQ